MPSLQQKMKAYKKNADQLKAAARAQNLRKRELPSLATTLFYSGSA